MKRIMLISIMIIALTASYGYAQMGGQQQMGKGGMMHGQGMMGQGMMGQGMGMMGMCPGMGPGMMGGMMGPGMMRGMMGHMGMMGPGMMKDYWSKPEVKKFLDETTDLRKELHLKKFEYMEALRNPDTSKETLTKLRQDMKKLKIQLFEKTPLEYGW